MISISEALLHITTHTTVVGDEKVSLHKAVGRVLAEDIVADMDLPPFDRSQMDGFALRSEDIGITPVELNIAGESAAGHGWHRKMKKGQAVRIMTGAPVPDGADTVQKVELTSEASFASDDAQKTNGKVTIFESVAAGKNIVLRGAEVKKGEHVLTSGERITERMIATLAAFGCKKVKVAKRPKVSILTTGSEVVEIDDKPGKDQIRNSNSVMLEALTVAAGGKPKLLPSTSDDLKAIKKVIAKAAKKSDIVVITGGVSVGKYDLTKAALIELGAEVYFDKVRLKPGKPAVFARLGEALVFGLPGNPVSAAVTFYLFVRKSFLLMQKTSETDLRRGTAIADGALKAAKERDTYLPAKLEYTSDGHVTATPLKWIGSSDFIGFAQADALAFVPGSGRIEKGELAEILFL